MVILYEEDIVVGCTLAYICKNTGSIFPFSVKAV